ncbi:MFS transporter [Streptomyces nitrosporeus]|uniref:MFS transporter n=1 Tax=Streptomyces nitrosporeus TaxID=28894 RepID=A0A5J6F2W1_9ACTN|nr:MFS transporter [Streptomyces nitrosporeus]QEU70629.1 MFS transporter [Streptomyces nitrosporeus]GGZ05785.1 tetracycline efflux MFS transporter Tet(V) [Streptomyces nitrosporeus]
MTVQPIPKPRPPAATPEGRRFARLWTAYTVNVAGDEFYVLAVPLIVYQVGGTAAAMSLVYACALLPQVFMGVWGGVLADRQDRIKLLRLCYLCSALVLLLAYAVFSAAHVSVGGLAVTATLLGVTAPVAAASFDSSLPHFVPHHALPRANAATEASRTTCVVMGPAVAGFAVSQLAPEQAVLFNSVSFVVAYLLLYRITSPAAPVKRAHGGLVSQWRDLTTGLRYLATGNAAVRVGVLTSTVVNFLFGAYEPMVIYRMRHDLSLGADTVGIIFAVSGVTSVAVALLLSWKAPSRGYLMVMGLSVALQGLAVAGLGAFTSLGAVIGAQVALATGTVLYTVYWRAMRQTVVPVELLGRVAGTCRSIAYGGAFLGSAVSAVTLNRFVGVNTALLLAGLVSTALGATVAGHVFWTRKVTGKSAP